MKLRFNEGHIQKWAEQYRYQQEEAGLVDLVPVVRKCGFLTLEHLRVVAHWKSPRSAGRVETNDDDYVTAITSFAFRTKNERAKIESLTLLDGVQWPTASVILHFFGCEKYPILDYRALWSVGIDPPPPYNFKVWWQYVVFCRDVANRTGTDMRTLDRALWGYSKTHQKK